MTRLALVLLLLLAVLATAANVYAVGIPEIGGYQKSAGTVDGNAYWNKQDSIKASDNKYANTIVAGGTGTQLNSYNFQFNYPDIATDPTLDSIIVWVEGFGTSSVHDSERTISVQLAKNSVVGSGDIVNGIFKNGSDSTIRFKGTTNGLWGTTWSIPNDINDNTSAGFNVFVWKKSTENPAGADSILIDHVQCAMYWTYTDATYEDTIKWVDTLRPSIDGITNSWVAVGTTKKWQAVDEITANDDTDYDSLGSDVGALNSEDLELSLAEWYPSDFISIDSIKIQFRAKKTGGTNGKLTAMININGTDYSYDTLTLSTSYQNKTTAAISVDPSTSSAWTKDSLMYGFFGVTNSQNTSFGNQHRITQLFVIVYWNKKTNRVKYTPDQDYPMFSELPSNDSSNAKNLYIGRKTTVGNRRSRVKGISYANVPVQPDSARLVLYFPQSGIGTKSASLDIQARAILRNYDPELHSGYSTWNKFLSSGPSWLKAGADSLYPNFKSDSGDVYTTAGTKTFTWSDSNTYLYVKLDDSSVIKGQNNSWGLGNTKGYVIKSSSESDSTERQFHSIEGSYEPYYEVYYTVRPPTVILGSGLYLNAFTRENASISMTANPADTGVFSTFDMYWKKGTDDWALAYHHLNTFSSSDTSISFAWMTPYIDTACSLMAIASTSTGNADTGYLEVNVLTSDDLVYQTFGEGYLEDVVPLDSANPTFNKGAPIIIRWDNSHRHTLYKGAFIPAEPSKDLRQNIRFFLRLYESNSNSVAALGVRSMPVTTDWNPGNNITGAADAGEVSWDSAKTGTVAWTTPGGDFDTSDPDTTFLSDNLSSSQGWFYIDITDAVTIPTNKYGEPDYSTNWILDGGAEIIYSPSTVNAWNFQDTSYANSPEIIMVSEDSYFILTSGGTNSFWAQVQTNIEKSAGSLDTMGAYISDAQNILGFSTWTTGINTPEVNHDFGIGMAGKTLAIWGQGGLASSAQNGSNNSASLNGGTPWTECSPNGGSTDGCAVNGATSIPNKIEVTWNPVATTGQIVNSLALGGGATSFSYLASAVLVSGNNSVGIGNRTPEFIFIQSHGEPSAVMSNSQDDDAQMSFGWAFLFDTTKQASFGYIDRNRSKPEICYQIIDTTKCISIPTFDGNFRNRVHYDSMTSSGGNTFLWFRYTPGPLIGQCWIQFWAIDMESGADIRMGTGTQRTTTGTTTLSTDTTTPFAALIIETDNTAWQTVQTGFSVSMGVASEGDGNLSSWTGTQSGANPRNCNKAQDTLSIVSMWNEAAATPTELAQATISAYNTNSLTLNWTTVDAVARKYIWLAFGKPQGLVEQPSPRRRIMLNQNN